MFVFLLWCVLLYSYSTPSNHSTQYLGDLYHKKRIEFKVIIRNTEAGHVTLTLSERNKIFLLKSFHTGKQDQTAEKTHPLYFYGFIISSPNTSLSPLTLCWVGGWSQSFRFNVDTRTCWASSAWLEPTDKHTHTHTQAHAALSRPLHFSGKLSLCSLWYFDDHDCSFPTWGTLCHCFGGHCDLNK